MIRCESCREVSSSIYDLAKRAKYVADLRNEIYTLSLVFCPFLPNATLTRKRYLTWSKADRSYTPIFCLRLGLQEKMETGLSHFFR
jgi:hypothetical protein